MNSPLLQLLVLAGIAVFLILRLRSVLGTRDGFEKPPVSGQEQTTPTAPRRPEFEVIEGGPDEDITDHVPQGSDAADALARMKAEDRDFMVGDFLQGARGAYEMILMAFEKGDMEGVRGFLAEDVHESFNEVIRERQAQGLSIEAEFVGVREVSLVDATFDTSTKLGEMTVRFVGELTSVVKDANGEIIEGSPTEVRRQKDVWTFARVMGSDDPNWQLVATGE